MNPDSKVHIPLAHSFACGIRSVVATFDCTRLICPSCLAALETALRSAIAEHVAAGNFVSDSEGLIGRFLGPEAVRRPNEARGGT